MTDMSDWTKGEVRVYLDLLRDVAKHKPISASQMEGLPSKVQVALEEVFTETITTEAPTKPLTWIEKLKKWGIGD